jgi:hypothetical protein
MLLAYASSVKVEPVSMRRYVYKRGGNLVVATYRRTEERCLTLGCLRCAR